MRFRVIPYGFWGAVSNALDPSSSNVVLEQVTSSKWAISIVPPLEADGKTPRVCGNHRVTFNPMLRRQKCTTEESEDRLPGFNGSCCFSQFYLQYSQFQVPLLSRFCELATNNALICSHFYILLPFPLSTSSGVFQKVDNLVIQDLVGAFGYQDDIIVGEPNESVHGERLLLLLQRSCEFNVAIISLKLVFN